MHPDVAHYGDHFRFKAGYFGTGPGASCFGDDVLSVAGDPGGAFSSNDRAYGFACKKDGIYRNEQGDITV